MLPQNWLFLRRYEELRIKTLTEEEYNLVAKLGEGGFESSAAAGAFLAMITLSAKVKSLELQLVMSDGCEPVSARTMSLSLMLHRVGATRKEQRFG